VADESQLIVVGVVCFGVGLLAGVALSFFFTQLTKLTESRYLEVETDEKGVIKQVVTAR